MSSVNTDKARATALVESWKPYFLDAYERDTRNARRQTFDEYWRWVKIYLLDGGAGHDGWLDQRAALIARVSDEAARARIGALSEEIGRRIAAEWAKESGYRKIYSTPFQGRPNLAEWGRRLNRAAAGDRGDGRAIESALRAIEADVDAALQP